MHYIFSCSTLWLLLVCLCGGSVITGCRAEVRPAFPTVEEGVLDLRRAVIDADSNIPLDGEWKFFWRQYVSNPFDAGDFEFAPLPARWNRLTWKGGAVPEQGYATYELEVLLPQDVKSLGIKVPDLSCAYRLYADGVLIGGRGTPGTTKETTIPSWSEEVYFVHTDKGSVRFDLQVANFHHSKGGGAQSLEIGSFQHLKHEKKLADALDIFLCGSILMGGLFFLGLYFFGRHDIPVLYFSLFCLFYSYRIAGSRQYALHSVFPNMNWYVALHLEYLTLSLSIAVFALYTRYLYPDDAPRKLVRWIAAICFAFSAAVIFTPVVVFTSLIDLFAVLILAGIATATVTYWRAFRNRRIGASYALLSTSAIFLIAVSIIMEYYGVATPFNIIVFTGYLIFFFSQSLILTFRFAFILKKSKEEAELGLKVKGEFLSTMSHEIRTPLNSVIGLTHLLLKESPREDQKERLEIMLFSSTNLLAIVNDVLDFSAMEQGRISFKKDAMNLSEIAGSLIKGYQAASQNPNLSFEVSLDPGLPELIEGDITRTTQVIGNLIHNAIKFTDSGYVRLSVTVLERNQETVTLKIAVKDTGIGIPPDKQKLIFDRFTQADSSTSRYYGGTGLGLSISRRILELQGINLMLESEEKKGALFYFVQQFRIIKDRAEEESTPAAVALPDNPLKGIRILVAEDNDMNIFVLQNFLKRWGADSTVAKNGREALEMTEKNSYDLILMDLHMPEMDGYEAVRRIRGNGLRLPIIALTASVASDVNKEIFSAGMNDIVVKPFVPDDLLKVLLKHLAPKKG